MRAALTRPEAAPVWRLLHWSLCAPSPVLMFDGSGARAGVFSCEEGVAQGDVLAPWAFANSVQPMYEAALEGSNAQGVAVLDDFNIMAEYTTALAAYDRFAARCRTESVRLNVAKSRVLWPHTAAPPPALERMCTDRGLTLVLGCMEVLGAWVGVLGARVQAAVVSAAEEHKQLFDALANRNMPAQLSMLILRMCGQPRMNYLSRVTPPRVGREGMERFDAMVVGCVRARLALPAIDSTSKALHILSMPIRTGGCGLRRYSLIMHAAYLASVAAATHLFNRAFVREQCAAPAPAPDAAPERVSVVMDVNVCLQALLASGLKGVLIPQTVEALWTEYERAVNVPPHLQQTIVAYLEVERMKERDRWSLSEQAAILSAQQRNSSLWLTVIPDQLCLQLTDFDFRAAICLRLHLAPHAPSQTHCRCSKSLSSAGYDHFYLCAQNRKAWLFARHEKVVRCVQMLASRACVTIQLNVPDPLADDQLQPDFQLDGLTTRIIGDVVISHPSAPSFAERCAREALRAAAHWEAEKSRKYLARAVNGYKLSHVSLESFGGIGKSAYRIITALATEAEAMSVMSHREYCAWALSALSVALQAGNARVVDGGLRGGRYARDV